MGGWQLEVFRMALYIAFPIGMFHYFNQPEVNEALVARARREMYAHTNDEEQESIKRMIEEIGKTENLKKIEELEREYEQMKK